MTRYSSVPQGSIGLATWKFGHASVNRATPAPLMGGSSMPVSSAMSASRLASPPELVTMWARRPNSTRPQPRISPTVVSSSRSAHRIAPTWRSAAAATRAFPASLPRWGDAPRLPDLRPPDLADREPLAGRGEVPRRLEEAGRVAEALDEGEHRVGALVGREEIEELGQAPAGPRAARDE